MTDPRSLAGVDLDAIKKRLKRSYGGGELWNKSYELRDIEALIAEVTRLRARLREQEEQHAERLVGRRDHSDFVRGSAVVADGVSPAEIVGGEAIPPDTPEMNYESRSPDGDGHRVEVGAEVGDSVDSSAGTVTTATGWRTRPSDDTRCRRATPTLTDERLAGSEPADSQPNREVGGGSALLPETEK